MEKITKSLIRFLPWGKGFIWGLPILCTMAHTTAVLAQNSTPTEEAPWNVPVVEIAFSGLAVLIILFVLCRRSQRV